MGIIDSVPKGEGKFFEQVLHISVLFHNATSDGRWSSLPMHLQRISKIYPSCHSIAMAVSFLVPEMKLVHGVYMGFIDGEGDNTGRMFLNTCAHSWNVTPSGTIIDSYPVGILAGGPVVVASHGTYKSFGANHYVAKPEIKTRLPMYKHWSMACLIADVVMYTASNQEKKSV